MKKVVSKKKVAKKEPSVRVSSFRPNKANPRNVTASTSGLHVTHVHLDGNADDASFIQFRQRMQSRFDDLVKACGPHLFTTSVNPDRLWAAYLEQFPIGERQYHNCNECRKFVQRYGGLVFIDSVGQTHSAFWAHDRLDDEHHRNSIMAILNKVRGSAVTGVFLPDPDQSTLGVELTGQWRHFGIRLGAGVATAKLNPLATPHQQMAEKVQEFGTVSCAISEFSARDVATAIDILKAGAYRAEKVMGPAEFLQTIHLALQAVQARPSKQRKNVIWRAVAGAPAGFCHPRSSVIGSLLEDVQAGFSSAACLERFNAKMNPLQYQRPTAALKAGNIAQAERAVERLGIERAFDRRYARLDEVNCVWRPTQVTTNQFSGDGMFAHLRTARPAGRELPSMTMTWEKFRRTLLIDVVSMEVLAPPRGNYSAFLTATHDDAPPILQWDTLENRNPVSWYVYAEGSDAWSWNLAGNSWVQCTGIVRRPSNWYGNQHHGDSMTFILLGCRDRTGGDSLCLFPEMMKSELHSIRQTIEAHSKSGRLSGASEASACGLAFENRPGAHPPVTVRIVLRSGNRQQVTIDRWD